ncbi:MAG: hypothetical protein IPP46_17145 [Bacteroidetes bacterium]|nr:hypothetical protein [Bacteroidota bacterium]
MESHGQFHHLETCANVTVNRNNINDILAAILATNSIDLPGKFPEIGRKYLFYRVIGPACTCCMGIGGMVHKVKELSGTAQLFLCDGVEGINKSLGK